MPKCNNITNVSHAIVQYEPLQQELEEFQCENRSLSLSGYAQGDFLNRRFEHFVDNANSATIT